MARTAYAKKIDADNQTNLARSRSGRDIASDYPPPGNLERRESCERDLRLFLETYFAAAFPLAWSPDHLRVIDVMERAVLEGGLFAMAMPRGSGKTSLSERAALWALLNGHRKFVCVVGATEAAATVILEHVKSELLNNDLLLADYRETCYPICKLENNGRRCVGQLFDGERTAIVWGTRRVVFPNLPDSACSGPNTSGACITTAGLTGALRGQAHTRLDGTIIRPEMLLLDDPQTRESAGSPSQTNDRLNIVSGDCLGMAGPGRQPTVFCCCTVIAENDLADRLLNQELNPQWHGERTRAVYQWPENESQWEQYRAFRRSAMKRGSDTSEATSFYAANRESMDRGAVVAWPERKFESDLSALEHMQNLRSDLGDFAFFAEFQNEPIRAALEVETQLTADQVAGKVSGRARGIVPAKASIITMFVDVHDQLLFWCVAGWSTDFTGAVIDYGVWPRQTKKLFTLRKASPTLADLAPGTGKHGAIRAGLEHVANDVLPREWIREDGTRLRIERCLIDCGYVSDSVYEFCRNSLHAGILLPSRGVGIGARNLPFEEFTPREGERHGWHWLVGTTSTRTSRYARFDTNHWKSFVHGRLGMAIGDVGDLSLFGRDPSEHALVSQHITGEAPTRVSANGRTVDEWAIRPGIADVHFLDCLVGCAVGASMSGATVPGIDAKPLKNEKPKHASRGDYDKRRAEYRAKTRL